MGRCLEAWVIKFNRDGRFLGEVAGSASGCRPAWALGTQSLELGLIVKAKAGPTGGPIRLSRYFWHL